MRKWTLSSFYLYLTCLTFVAAWWLFAFHSSSPPLLEKDNLKFPQQLSFLSSLKRETLQQALAGDTHLMFEFIQQWDQDARLLKQKEIKGIQQLSASKYEQASLLANILHQENHKIKKDLNDRSLKRLLPQTFVSASILLALVQPEQMIAIPKGLRQLPHLYPSSLLNCIQQDVEQLSSESTFAKNPDLAFISHYSNPAIAARFQQQQIPLCLLSQLDTIIDIQQAIEKIGCLVQQPLKAELLSLFMEAALLAIDNRLHALQDLIHSSACCTRILYLYYQQHYMLPTTKCLTGQLLERASKHHTKLICPVEAHACMWRVPFEREKILAFNPDCLIISMPYPLQPIRSPIFKSFESKPIFYLDETVQESPTQYIILAYFDIFNAIAAFYI